MKTSIQSQNISPFGLAATLIEESFIYISQSHLATQWIGCGLIEHK